MADIVVRSVKQVTEIVNKALRDALANEVYAEVVREMGDQIDDVVYGAYPWPAKYGRRKLSGGLADPANMPQEMQGNTLIVRNTTPPADGDGYTTNKDLPAVVEYGITSQYDFYKATKPEHTFGAPRPFIAETIDALSDKKAIISALQRGLKRQGINSVALE